MSKFKAGDKIREKRTGKVVEIGYSGNVYVRWDDGRDDWMRPSELEHVLEPTLDKCPDKEG